MLVGRWPIMRRRRPTTLLVAPPRQRQQRHPQQVPARSMATTSSTSKRRARARSLMIFASEVPVISAMNPYRKIEEVFFAAWKRTNPVQVAALEAELAVTIASPEEEMRTVVEALGATAAIDALLQEAAAAETTTDVRASARQLGAALPASTPAAVREQVVQHFASEMHKDFGTRQEAPAIATYEREQRVVVAERNVAFHKRRLTRVGGVELYVGGKIDGRADGRVIEVKNRLSRFMSPLPRYDVAQLQTYLFILNATDGELVEHLRAQGQPTATKVTPVPWDPVLWETQIAPYVARFGAALVGFMADPEAQAAFLTSADADARRAIVRDHWVAASVVPS